MAETVAPGEAAPREEVGVRRLHQLSAVELLAAPAFPRISPDEEFLLRDWLRLVADAYDEFSVDVPLGGGSVADSPIASAGDRMWAAITRRRVDLVAVSGHSVHIVEAKLYARLSTVTQVRRYCDEYRASHPEAWRVVPVVVCRSASPGVAQVLTTIGGALTELPAIAPAQQVFE